MGWSCLFVIQFSARHSYLLFVAQERPLVTLIGQGLIFLF